MFSDSGDSQGYGKIMVEGSVGGERRKYKRVSVDFPVVYRIHGMRFMGKAVNASNEGMMIESYLGLGAALSLLQILANRREYRTNLQFTYKGKGFRTEAEIRHLHLHFFGKEPCKSELGLFAPKMT
jgi:hypothetical protein